MGDNSTTDDRTWPTEKRKINCKASTMMRKKPKSETKTLCPGPLSSPSPPLQAHTAICSTDSNHLSAQVLAKTAPPRAPVGARGAPAAPARPSRSPPQAAPTGAVGPHPGHSSRSAGAPQPQQFFVSSVAMMASCLISMSSVGRSISTVRAGRRLLVAASSTGSG